MAKDSHGLLLWGALALGAALTATPAYAAVGRTAGSFDVSNGTTSYTIPIFTPPGPHGLQPTVALRYSSSTGVGSIGRGWSLGGELASAIHSCPSTIAQDGYAGLSNRYCLDGNRLRLQSGSYGVGGSVYMTEAADLSRATLSGTAYCNTQSWTVERKDGLIYVYGGTSDSRSLPCAEWRLSEIQDRAGNKVRFTWKVADSTTSGGTHPVKIEWTQTSAGSGSYVYSMDFIYSAGGNAGTSSYFRSRIGRGLVYDQDLLTSITVSTSGTVKRKYVLTYDNSPTTGAKRLTQVKECSDSAATDCFSPTNITYQGGTPGFTTTPVSGVTNGTKCDLDGDGFKDSIYNSSGTYYVKLGGASGYDSGHTTGITTTYWCGRLNGTGADQLLAASSGTWYIYAWNGSSFSATSTGVTVAASSADIVLLDVDGDSRDDLVWNSAIGGWNTSGTVTMYVRRNTSTAGSVSFASPVSSSIDFANYLPPGVTDLYPAWDPPDGYGANIMSAGMTRGGDSDGDGRKEINLSVQWDFCLYYNYAPYYCMYQGQFSMNFPVWLSTVLTAGFANYQWAAGWPSGMDYSATQLIDADFNGDGCDDYLVNSQTVGLSACQLGSISTVVTDSSGLGSYVGAADWDGDGKDDYFVTNGYAIPFVGNAMGTPVNTGISASYSVSRTDGNGDGLDDAVVDGMIYNHSDTDVVPDLATEFEDGFGVTYTVVYTNIARGHHTPGSSATYPTEDLHGGRRVVASVTATDGIGGTYDTDYQYFGAQGNREGRGFMGFARIESVDSRSGIKHELQFEQEFPYKGMLKAENTYQPAGAGGQLISSRTFTVSQTQLSSTPYNERTLAYTSDIVEDVYEVGGASNGNWITRTALSNTYDGWGNLTASTRTVTDKDASSPLYTYAWVSSSSTTYSPDTTYWCLGLPTATSVTQSTTTGEASVTRSKSFTPDYVNCRMDAESIEPASSTMRVDTSYGYDDFGNVNSVSVTGRKPDTSSMSTRTATTSWGTTGQFPVSVTNPLSQTTTRTFHGTFGSLLTETDPNSIVVASNTYDAFGRIERATRADGTSTVYTPSLCSPYCENGAPGTGGGLDRYYVLSSERDTGDSQTRVDTTHFDQLNRPILQHTQLMSGGYSRIGREYDTQGRLARETAPCDNGSCTAYWVTNDYDLLGRLVTQSRPRSAGDPSAVTTSLAYAGRTQTVTDPNSKLSTKVMDVNGWMRRSRDHDSYGQNLSYDAAGSLTGVADTASNTLFSASYYYGAKPFQYSTTDMDLGSWSYAYNSLGELVSWQDANTNSFSQTYDALSRVLTRTEAEGTTTWTWGTNSGSHNIGRLAGVSMPNYSEALSYDSVGRPTTRSITAYSNTYDIDTTYNNEGLLDTLTYPTSTPGTRVKVKYGYAFGILQSVTDWTSGSAGTVYWTANAKNVRGQTTQETLGNGVVTNRNFDAVTGWLNSSQSGVSGGTGLQHLSYLYDKTGFVMQRQENSLGITESFYPDNLYRLDYSTLNSGGGAVTNLTMTYDAMGNITARSDVNGNATWTYDGTRKHAVTSTGTGGVTYSYDNNGNMTSRDGQTITWASFNYPTDLATATESTTFYYGPDRQYYRQDYNGPSSSETTYYIGGLMEKVCPTTSCLSGTIDWRHYIVAEGQTVAIVSRKSSSVNTVSYPLEDNQGSSSTLTDGSGANLVRVSYNAFGLPRDGDDWDGAEQSGHLTTMEGISRRGYTSHSMLGRMGLIHMNGRVQDAVTGRFLSADPTIPNPRFTQSYNRYAYVNNNPLSYIDPSGFADQRPDEDLPEVEIICAHSIWCAFEIAMRRHCAVFTCGDDFLPTMPGLPYYNSGGGGGGVGPHRLVPATAGDIVAEPVESEEQPQTEIPCKAGTQCSVVPKCLRSASGDVQNAYRSARNTAFSRLNDSRGRYEESYAVFRNNTSGDLSSYFETGKKDSVGVVLSRPGSTLQFTGHIHNHEVGSMYWWGIIPLPLDRYGSGPSDLDKTTRSNFPSVPFLLHEDGYGEAPWQTMCY